MSDKKCTCDRLGASMRGEPLCDAQLSAAETIAELTKMLADSGFSISRRQKHAIRQAIRELNDIPR